MQPEPSDPSHSSLSVASGWDLGVGHAVWSASTAASLTGISRRFEMSGNLRPDSDATAHDTFQVFEHPPDPLRAHFWGLRLGSGHRAFASHDICRFHAHFTFRDFLAIYPQL